MERRLALFGIGQEPVRAINASTDFGPDRRSTATPAFPLAEERATIVSGAVRDLSPSSAQYGLPENCLKVQELTDQHDFLQPDGFE